MSIWSTDAFYDCSLWRHEKRHYLGPVARYWLIWAPLLWQRPPLRWPVVKVEWGCWWNVMTVVAVTDLTTWWYGRISSADRQTDRQTEVYDSGEQWVTLIVYRHRVPSCRRVDIYWRYCSTCVAGWLLAGWSKWLTGARVTRADTHSLQLSLSLSLSLYLSVCLCVLSLVYMSDLTLINWTAICSCALRAPPRQRRPIGWQTTHRCNPERVHSSYALDWVFYQTSATRSPLLNTNSISGFVYHRVQSQPWLSLTLFGFLCRLLLLRYRKGCQVLWWVRLCVCVCVCVCVAICLYARISLELHARSLPNYLCILPMAVTRSFSGVVAIRYVMYFRFCGWHHVVFYNRPYSGMNFATNDWFGLNLLMCSKVGYNSISYY